MASLARACWAVYFYQDKYVDLQVSLELRQFRPWTIILLEIDSPPIIGARFKSLIAVACRRLHQTL